MQKEVYHRMTGARVTCFLFASLLGVILISLLKVPAYAQEPANPSPRVGLVLSGGGGPWYGPYWRDQGTGRNRDADWT